VASGCAVVLDHGADEILRIPLPDEALDAECERLRRAVALAREDLGALREETRQELSPELQAIFEAQALLLDDEALLGRIERWIHDRRVNAEWAVHRVELELARQFERLDSPHLRERVDDVRDVARHLRRALRGLGPHQLSEVGQDVILVAHDLTPSEAVRLGRQQVAGFALETGGPTSHTAIIARSLHLPLVSGLEGLREVPLGDRQVLVDGDRGRVVVDPSAEELEEGRARRRAEDRHAHEMAATRSLAPITADGVAVQLMANIDLPEEIDEAVLFGAAGVGLYRSEFLFIEKAPELPSEDEQLSALCRLLEAARPHPAVVRTFDLGGRKLAREVMHTDEENPVLGLRGIRLTLARPQVFRHQVRALLRAAPFGDLWVLLPMVATVEEIHAFRRSVAEAAAELAAAGLSYATDFRLGIMIEVPAAALIADRLAREVDFFAIGTNDLIQYALAVDRNNEHVAYLYQPLHPAILRMLRFVIDSARTAGIDVSLCGEMAADPALTPLLLGLGLRRLSITPRALPEIKARVRSLEVRRLTALAERCLDASSAAEVEALLASELAVVS
jgi:phosphotransferase system enzyme I (PtsI)